MTYGFSGTALRTIMACALLGWSGAGMAEQTGADFAPASLPDASLFELSFSGDSTDVRPMSEAELDENRGGYGGIYFSLYGFGDISQLSGGLPEGVELNSMSPDLVSMNLGLATLPNTGGFIQFANVVGNNNVVNNTLLLNVYILEGGVADTSGITNGSAFGL